MVYISYCIYLKCILINIELHILLFRRPLNTNGMTGKAPNGWKPPKNLTENEIKMWLDPSDLDKYYKNKNNNNNNDIDDDDLDDDDDDNDNDLNKNNNNNDNDIDDSDEI